MLAQALIVHRGDKRSEVQNQWTSAMLRARDLAIQTTSDCKIEIAVRILITTLTSVVVHAQYQTVLSEMNDHLPKRAMGVGPLHCCKTATAQRTIKMVGVSRGGAHY